ncbi:MAG: YfbM family protein [Actinomycetota bacterium]|nr:YfbM family protein [Actinomycetota bacterium]
MLYLRVSDVDALERDPDVAAQWFADGSPVDLGAAWHGLHVLLNGSAWGGSPPLFDAVLGGTPLGDPSSYEPIRYVSVGAVEAVAEALPPAEELVPRFTHKAMRLAEAYPDGWWDEPDVLTARLLPAYHDLVLLFTDAAAAGEAVLITLERD